MSKPIGGHRVTWDGKLSSPQGECRHCRVKVKLDMTGGPRGGICRIWLVAGQWVRDPPTCSRIREEQGG